MRTPPVDVERLILDIHRCALSPDLWPDVLARVVVALDAGGANLITPGTNVLEVTHGVADDMLSLYRAHYVDEDPWLRGAIERDAFHPGVVALDDALVDRRRMLNSAFFHDFLKRQDIDRAICACLHDGSSRAGIPPAALSVFRPVGREAFTDQHSALLRRLVPHLQVAVENALRAQALGLERAIAAHALDRVGAAAFIVDGRGRADAVNTAAERSLRDAEWLQLKAGVLTLAAGARCRTDLRRTLTALVEAGRSCALEIVRGTARAMLVGSPFAGVVAVGRHPPRAERGLLWLLVEPTESSGADLVANAYALSTAERRLLRLLAGGTALSAAADLLGVTANTARVQLKSIFAKTGRRRQSDLVALVQRLTLIAATPR